MLIATGSPVGPIIAVNELRVKTHYGGIHVPYVVWLRKIEIYLQPLCPQNLKICITAYGNLEEP